MRLDFESLYEEGRSDAFKEGKKLYYDNKTGRPSIECDNGKLCVKASVTDDKEYRPQIFFDEQGGLYDYCCDCGDFSASDGPCRHIVAAALAGEENQPSAPACVYRNSDSLSLKLISLYGRLRHQRTLPDEVKTRLFPFLSIGSGKASLRLFIAKNRRYKVKDIAEFAQCCREKAYKRYGVELAFVHTQENFTASSARLAALVAAGAAETRFDLKDEMPLSAGDTDALLELMGGESIECESAKLAVAACTVVKDGFRPRLSIKRDKYGFVAALSPSYELFFGRNKTYVLTEGRIYVLASDNLLLPLLTSLEEVDGLFVSSADMTQFYNNVIAPVAVELEVDSDVDLTAFASPPLTARLYLDLDGQAVSGRLVTSYGEQEVDIFAEDYSGTARDEETERALRGLLSKFFPAAPLLYVGDDDVIYELIGGGLNEIYNYADIYLGESFRRMRSRRPPRMRLGVRLKNGLVDLDFAADEFSPEELNAVLDGLKRGRRYVRLQGGAFIDLGGAELRVLTDILNLGDLNGNELKLAAGYGPFISSELKESRLPVEADAAFEAQMQTGDAQPPPLLGGVLRPYQITGFKWMKSLTDRGFGAVLADDMGLGKSLQLIALMLTVDGLKLIVCPTTLILNWKHEIAKFAPDLRVLTVMGSAAEREAAIAGRNEYDVIVTSYELLRRDGGKYAPIEFALVAADEAQYIKNPDTRNSQAIKELKAERRLALTGTPIENSLSELWSIFDFVMPGYLRSYSYFREHFEAKIVQGDEDKALKLKRLVSPFILRRLKSEVLPELPTKVECEIAAPLTGEQRLLYAAQLTAARESLKNGETNKLIVLSMLTRLRQICCDPALVQPDYKGNSVKLDTCMELIKAAAALGRKVLVFSQFTSMLEILRAHIAAAGLSCYVLKGDTPKSDRMKSIDRFNGDKTEVFLISLRAGGNGINLTGAEVVIHYDPWWNDSVMSQATDRAYRLGQKKSVQVYKLTIEDTIEQKINELQRKKTALGNIFVGGESKLPLEELVKLFD